MTYSDLVDAVMTAYRKRITKFLTGLRTKLKEQGFSCKPVYIETIFDEYQFRFPFEKNGHEFGYVLTIAESMMHEGSEDGISFHVDVYTKDGQDLCQFKPFNYTEKCWVGLDDEEAVNARWKLVEDGYPFDDLLTHLNDTLN